MKMQMYYKIKIHCYQTFMKGIQKAYFTPNKLKKTHLDRLCNIMDTT